MRQERRPSLAALLPAAGRGERLGLGPKAFLPLGEGSLLRYAAACFEGKVDEIIVAVPPELTDAARRHLSASSQVIGGKTTRQETVYELLRSSRADIVLIHDAARPFLPEQVLANVIRSAKACGAASVVRPVADSLIEAQTGAVVERSRFRAVQTPQAFRRTLILEAHAKAQQEKLSATDDAALVRHLGHEVALVEGSAWLMKVTTEADYDMAQALVETWHRAHA